METLRLLKTVHHEAGHVTVWTMSSRDVEYQCMAAVDIRSVKDDYVIVLPSDKSIHIVKFG